MYQIKCTIDGIVPLLQHRYPVEDKIVGDKKRTIKSSSDERGGLEKMAFKDEKGMFMTTEHIYGMLVGNRYRKGAAQILGSQIEHNKGSLYLGFCKSSIGVESTNGSPEKLYFQPHRKTWDDTDIRSYTKEQGRDVIERPMMNLPWSISFILSVYDDNFKEGKVRELFEVAGLRCGLGAYGPRFGRFIVKEWEKLSVKQ